MKINNSKIKEIDYNKYRYPEYQEMVDINTRNIFNYAKIESIVNRLGSFC